ncbi:MAG TPA: SMP-30/gluconolactonase/LRE family protein [Candidatus Cybelea sp.]
MVSFYGPDNIAFDRSRKLYVTDSDGRTIARVLVLTPDGRLVAQWHVFAAAEGGSGYGPEGIALDRSGNVLVTDAARGSVIELTPQGKLTKTLGKPAAFPNLGHVAVDAQGNVYVAQAQPNLLEKLSSSGSLLERWHRKSGSKPNEWDGP